MTRAGRSWWLPLVAVVALVGSVIWTLVQAQGVGAWGPGARSGVPGSGYGSMMGGTRWGDGSMVGGTRWGDGSMVGGTRRGDGSMMGGTRRGRSDTTGQSVENLGDARTAAEAFAGDLGPGLSVGEVMQFENQYYAKTRYGMMAAGSGERADRSGPGRGDRRPVGQQHDR